jgi:hypothetical protein
MHESNLRRNKNLNQNKNKRKERNYMKIKPTMKNNKSKEKQKSKTQTKKLYLSVASAPLTSIEMFEIQDYLNAFMLAACILKTNRWDLST